MATSNYASLFQTGFREFTGLEYKELARKTDSIYHVTRTDGRFIDEMGWELYGRPIRRNPGEPHGPGAIAESFGMHAVIVGYGLMDSLPKEDIDDDRYGVLTRVIPAKSGAMARSFNVNEELVGFEYLENSFATGTGKATFDGVSLFSTAHPISKSASSTTVANRPSADVDLSIAAADAARTNLVSQFAANYTERLENAPRVVVVNPAWYRIAVQVFKADIERGTMNDMNVVKEYGVGIIQSAYWEKSGTTGTNNAWFIVGETHGLKKVVRESFDIETDMDITTKSLIVVADQRFVVYHNDWRGTYGSTGT